MSCPSASIVQAYLDGVATDAERGTMLAHLERCAGCRDIVLALAPEPPTGAAKPAALASSADDEIARGQLVGRFVVLSRIGAGGMGVVYAAYDPELDRKVALKLIRRPLAGGDEAARALEKRLVREAQAMARVSHPNVAVVHDVGRHGEQVFIAMELIDGETAAAWLSRRERSQREIVGVFTAAGRGLAAAHAAGLVHRDFKPNNVMIDEDGRVRVLDFGLARSGLGDGPASPPLRVPIDGATGSGTLLGTPGYIAPEQLAGAPVDARGDQFSFCVALYEALGGVRPFVGEDSGAQLAAIRAQRLQAPKRALGRALLRALVRGLRADPAERWPSMEELIAALERSRSQPQRWLWAGGSVLALAGLLGAVRAVAHERRLCLGAEERLAGVWDGERKRSVHAAFAATGKSYANDAYASVERALDDYAARWTRMATDSCQATHVRGEQSAEALDLRSECLDARREGLRALVDVLARADAGVVDKAVRAAGALEPLDACADVAGLRQPVRAPRDPAARARIDGVRRQLDRAKALLDSGQYIEAQPLARDAVAHAAAIAYKPLEAQARVIAAKADVKAGKYPDAVDGYVRAAADALAGRDDYLVARSFNALLFVVGALEERPAEAHAWERLASAATERAKNPLAEVALLNGRTNLAWEEARYDEARPLAERTLALRERILGSEHPEVLGDLSNLAGILKDMGHHAEAEAIDRRLVALDEKVFGATHPETAASLNNLGLDLLYQGKLEDALATLGRSLELRARALGPEHPDLADSYNNLGLTLFELGRFQDALDRQERALAIRRRAFGPDELPTALSLANAAKALEAIGRHQQALDYQRRALDIRERRLGRDHTAVAESLFSMGDTLESLGRPEEALAANRRALAIVEKKLGAEHPDAAYALRGIGAALLALGDAPGAVAALERSLALRQSASGSAEQLAPTRFLLARSLWEANRDRARARALALEARTGLLRETQRRDRDQVDAWLARHR
jgi:tetratricopeptide (TPR) repeat protein